MRSPEDLFTWDKWSIVYVIVLLHLIAVVITAHIVHYREAFAHVKSLLMVAESLQLQRSVAQTLCFGFGN